MYVPDISINNFQNSGSNDNLNIRMEIAHSIMSTRFTRVKMDIIEFTKSNMSGVQLLIELNIKEFCRL